MHLLKKAYFLPQVSNMVEMKYHFYALQSSELSRKLYVIP